MGLAEEEHIVLHGYIETPDLPGIQEWCQVDDGDATGWSVYRRGVTSENGEFAINDEQDFADLADAEAYAAQLAGLHGGLFIFVD